VDQPESHADDGTSRRQHLNGKTDVPMKNPRAELQERHDAIGAGLKRIFDEVVGEPVPPEFLALLDEIDRKNEV
jgi:hypothetical protein